MSEDCHDSNNINPFTGEPRWLLPELEKALSDQLTSMPCTECGEPVKPGEAFVCDMEHQDGTTEVAVFHKGLDKMCAFKWSARKLEEANRKLEAILDLWGVPRSKGESQ